MEYFCNYQDMPPERRKSALHALESIGFYPACGDEKTMQDIMDESSGEKMPQFYFAFREQELIGYMFLLGDSKRFRAFPWLAIDNLDELPWNIAEPLSDIAIKTWENEGGSIENDDGSITEKRMIAQTYRERLKRFGR